MKWKWIVGSFLALVIVVIAAAYVIVSTYDFSSLKPRLVQTVREATGRELLVHGDINIAFGLTPYRRRKGQRFFQMNRFNWRHSDGSTSIWPYRWKRCCYHG